MRHLLPVLGAYKKQGMSVCCCLGKLPEGGLEVKRWQGTAPLTSGAIKSCPEKNFFLIILILNDRQQPGSIQEFNLKGLSIMHGREGSDRRANVAYEFIIKTLEMTAITLYLLSILNSRQLTCGFSQFFYLHMSRHAHDFQLSIS